MSEILVETEASKLKRALKYEQKALRSVRSSIKGTQRMAEGKTPQIAAAYLDSLPRLWGQEALIARSVKNLKAQLAEAEATLYR